MYCCYLFYFIRFLFFTVYLLYVIARMNRYVMFLLWQRRLNELIIIIIITSCKCCLSASPLSLISTIVLSANFNTLIIISSSKSLIYIKNKIGPNIDPCGTPLKTDLQFEASSSTTTLCLLPISHFFYPGNHTVPDAMGL